MRELVLVREAVENTSVERLFQRTAQPNRQVFRGGGNEHVVRMPVSTPVNDPGERVILSRPGGFILQEVDDVVPMAADECSVDVHEAMGNTRAPTLAPGTDTHVDGLTGL